MIPNVWRAVDLYSGAGGWSLGLRMAGIQVVASYDKWKPANETNFKNNSHTTYTTDIRKLELSTLPDAIDIVVGSPPCTEFSYSNRGGNGNIHNGLEDIIKFLSIVDRIRPRAWAMENVPRVARVLETELRPGGRLEPFSHLNISYRVIKMEEYGLPQRRRRCIAGNLDFNKLESYKRQLKSHTLGDIVHAFAGENVTDPHYGITLPKEEIFDHEIEDFLSEEEQRINQANKIYHPIYNNMAFPDPFDRCVRTVTATCTRVSRESIIIKVPEQKNALRRLTIRERATLQGFPITFQFYGTSYDQKVRMIGNAVPPIFSYYVAMAMLEKESTDLSNVPKAALEINLPNIKSTFTPAPKVGSRYSSQRKFRFAIPSLHLKSGVRFELLNSIETTRIIWKVCFVFGTSKSIHRIDLDKPLLDALIPNISSISSIKEELKKLEAYMQDVDVLHLQDLWSHRGPGATRPFALLDQLDETGRKLSSLIAEKSSMAQSVVTLVLSLQHQNQIAKLKGLDKLNRNAATIVAGLIVGCIANNSLMPATRTNSYKRVRISQRMPM